MSILRPLPVVLLAALALAGAAGATPPTLLSAGQSGGYARATWTLPAGASTWSVEVASAAAVGSDGSFLQENVVDLAISGDGNLSTTDTSWTSQVQLDPGTYYLHVSGEDPSCTTCVDVYEWSATRTFTVPGAAASSGDAGTTTPSPAQAQTPTVAPTPVVAPAPVQSGSQPAAGGSDTGAAASAQANAAPTVGPLSLARSGSLLHVRMSICDDAAGPLSVAVVARRGVRARGVSGTVVALVPGCAGYSLGIGLPPGSGRATVTVIVGDAAGARSGPAVGRI